MANNFPYLTNYWKFSFVLIIIPDEWAELLQMVIAGQHPIITFFFLIFADIPEDYCKTGDPNYPDYVDCKKLPDSQKVKKTTVIPIIGPSKN